mmetsp:Transcript_9937/g.37044  ORF Transcript_9937/g.37044 Transcript_9937/m.37044 type:complete len:87 (-) Transcript_9937:383-643(-)
MQVASRRIIRQVHDCASWQNGRQYDLPGVQFSGMFVGTSHQSVMSKKDHKMVHVPFILQLPSWNVLFLSGNASSISFGNHKRTSSR